MNRLKTNERDTKTSHLGYSLNDVRWARATGMFIGAAGATVFWGSFVTIMKVLFEL